MTQTVEEKPFHYEENGDEPKQYHAMEIRTKLKLEDFQVDLEDSQVDRARLGKKMVEYKKEADLLAEEMIKHLKKNIDAFPVGKEIHVGTILGLPSKLWAGATLRKQFATLTRGGFQGMVSDSMNAQLGDSSELKGITLRTSSGEFAPSDVEDAGEGSFDIFVTRTPEKPQGKTEKEVAKRSTGIRARLANFLAI